MNTLPGYQLEYRLGEGSAGTVWRARQSASLDRPVAVKRLRAQGGAAGAEQLRVEAEALACLDHPHIVRIFEILADGDGVAIAMQLAGGGSLDERLRRRGPMPPAEVADVAAKLAAALASAHRRGVLHRDVKPGNVLFTTDGEPLLSDFGICSSAVAPDEVIRGTEPYLDPTVRTGRPPDAAADVYALGAVAWEMLTGEPPAAPRPPLADAAPAVPAGLAAVVERALAADPGARFASAAELAGALRAATPPPPPEPSGDAEAADPAPAGPDRGTRTFGPRPPAPVAPARRRPRRAALLATLVVVAGAAGAAYTWTARRDERRPAAGPVSPPAGGCVAAETPPVAEGGEVLQGDLDGDGCPEPVIRTGNVLERPGADGRTERFVLGNNGDLALLGDWDCDGVATPGLFRAATSEAFHFDGWARPGEALPAAERVAAESPTVPPC